MAEETRNIVENAMVYGVKILSMNTHQKRMLSREMDYCWRVAGRSRMERVRNNTKTSR